MWRRSALAEGLYWALSHSYDKYSQRLGKLWTNNVETVAWMIAGRKLERAGFLWLLCAVWLYSGTRSGLHWLIIAPHSSAFEVCGQIQCRPAENLHCLIVLHRAVECRNPVHLLCKLHCNNVHYLVVLLVPFSGAHLMFEPPDTQFFFFCKEAIVKKMLMKIVLRLNGSFSHIVWWGKVTWPVACAFYVKCVSIEVYALAGKKLSKV